MIVNEQARLRAVRATVALLVLVGVGAAVGRTIFPDDMITRAEPVRQWVLQAWGSTDPFAATRAAELAFVDGRFAEHPVLTRAHVLFGAAFLLFAPLQFFARIRARHIRLHRWSGRVLLPLAAMSVIASFYFGLLIPYGGFAEAIGIGLFGGLFLVSVARGFVAIRRKQVAIHREWMIRAFAIALSISTVRLLGGPFDVVLTPTGVPERVVFVITIWTGWIITVGAAELWIRHTRSNPPLQGNLRTATPVTISDLQA